MNQQPAEKGLISVIFKVSLVFLVYCFDAFMIDFCQICYNGAFSFCDGFGSSSGLADKFH